ncbi:glucosaminidase domain-containing protein [Bacillus paralicheniformis]|uniref:glucosaminidase domain-containing protein n=1 Tax=Bacillus paralicheniformis TaxID=1648923 RepID=UPI003F79E32D
MARSDFIKEIAPDAQKIYKKYDILASLIIAQACLESAWGTSGLAQKGKNLFGIKGTYNGQYVLMWTTEYDRKGNATRVQAKFRKYPSWYASLQDLAKLYVNGTSWDPNHYKAVVGEKDYKKATAALVKAGYATDPNYATKLNSLIETYHLDTAKSGSYGTIDSGNLDGTVTKNVTVENCYFGASAEMGAFHAGVGSHSAVTGKFYENIKVINNTFEGMRYYSVKPMKWRGVVVSGNRFLNTYGGVYVAPIPDGQLYDLGGTKVTYETGSDVVINANTFENMGEKAIYVLGRKEIYQQDVTISNNIVSGTADGKKGIFIRYADGVNISNHQSKNTGSQAIYAEFSQNISASGGEFKTTKTDGIKLNAVKQANINNVSIQDTGTHGIMTYGGCSGIDLKYNKITDPSQSSAGGFDGIYMSNDTTDSSLIANKIRSSKKAPRRGIWVTATCDNIVAFGNDTRCRAVEADSYRNSATNKIETSGNV